MVFGEVGGKIQIDQRESFLKAFDSAGPVALGCRTSISVWAIRGQLSYRLLPLRRGVGYISRLVPPDKSRPECESQQGRLVAIALEQQFASERWPK